MLEEGVSSPPPNNTKTNFSDVINSIDSKTLDLSKLNDLENTAMDANSLDLRPDPIHLVNMIREIKRKEVASRFFMRILMANMESQTRSLEQSQREADPTR